MAASVATTASCKMINVLFSSIDSKHALKIPVFDAERIYFLSEFSSHLSTVV